MKNKILLPLIFLPCFLFAQQNHHSGYTDWWRNNPSPTQVKNHSAASKLRDITYYLSGTRRDTFDLAGGTFNIVDSAQYLYFGADSLLYSYVHLVHDVDSGWINYLAYYYGYDTQENNDSIVLAYWDDTNLLWLAQQLTLNTFNANSDVLTSTFAIWDSIEWKNVSEILNDYDANSNLTQQVQLSWNGASWDTSSKFVFSYDANNNRIEEIDYDETGAQSLKYTTSFDAANYETQNVQQYWGGNSWKNQWRDTLSYDANNNVVIYERRDWHSGSFSLTDTKYWYEYDGMNHLIERIDSNGDGASSYFPAYHYEYSYDSSSNLSYVLEQRFNSATLSFDNAEQTFYYYTTIISGVNSPVSNNELSCNLYPNPCEETLRVVINALHNSNIELEIANVTGRIISHQSFAAKPGTSSLNVDVSKLPAGVYLLHVYDSQTKVESTNRFVKE